MGHKPRQKEKTQRAFGAYLELVDTADWIRRELRGPLESFGFTMAEFRVLEILHRDGPLTISIAAEKLQRHLPNFRTTFLNLEKLGWVRRQSVRLPPAEIRESRLPKARRGKPRVGRRVGVISLTKMGEAVVGKVLPRQAKLVKAHMRVLSYKEQGKLSLLCRKLHEGDVLKFVSEITHEDVEEEA
jgi:DNA-binding MarR family transcriptional regulator